MERRARADRLGGGASSNSNSVTSALQVLLGIFALTLSTACNRSPSQRLLMTQKIDGKWQVAIVSFGWKGTPVRQSMPELVGAEPYAGGTKIMALRAEGGHGRLLSIDVATGERRDGPEVGIVDMINDVSADGSRVLLRAFGTPDTVRIVDVASGRRVEHALRYVASAALSPEGDEALVSGVPTDCVEKSYDACPMPLVRLRFDGGTTEIARPGPGATYHARYLPGGRVAFQTTTLSGCSGINACRHDIVTVPRGDLGAAPVLLRQNGYGPSFSSDPKTFAFLVSDEPETHCSKLPCDTASLYFAKGSSIHRVVSGEVTNLPARALSPDGGWVGYRKKDDVRVCRTDGGKCIELGEGSFLGWLR